MKKTPPKGVVNYVIYDKVNYIIPSHRVFDAPLAL